MTVERTAPAAGDDQPIRDAAAILLVDRDGTEPRLLMGRRRADNVFLPNKWVYPGGRLEASDHAALQPATLLQPGDAGALLARLDDGAPHATMAQALALAAVRELYEETGFALASTAACPSAIVPMPPWDAFAARGLWPSLEPLRFFARAVTPPGRTRRYDTRFFLAGRHAAVEAAGACDGEFTDIDWFTLAEAAALDLPNITRAILGDLRVHLAEPHDARPVPFYYERGGVYHRDLIARG